MTTCFGLKNNEKEQRLLVKQKIASGVQKHMKIRKYQILLIKLKLKTPLHATKANYIHQPQASKKNLTQKKTTFKMVNIFPVARWDNQKGTECDSSRRAKKV